MIVRNVFKLKINRVLLDLCTALNPFHAVLNIFGKGRNFQLAGLSLWGITIAGYLIISIMAICVALVNFTRMRSCIVSV